MADQVGIAAVRDMGRQSIDQAKTLVRASQQEHAAVGADRAAVEGGGHLLVQANRVKISCPDEARQELVIPPRGLTP